MTSLWLRDLASFALQVTLIVSAGALLASIFRLRASVAALVFWQAMLALCLLLPVCQRWKPATSRIGVARVPVTSPAAGVATAVAAAPQPSRWPIRWPADWPLEQAALLVISVGILARGLSLVIGFRGLARLRVQSEPAPQTLGPLSEAAQRQTGARAEFRISARAAAPITFGLRRPIILLPPGIASMDPETQRAIVCHELVHVRRRDWLWCVAEEFTAAVFWFHPAVWWLIARIHLVREQVVDHAVIDLTASRQGYVEALLAVAQANMNARLIPAPLFLRKGLLKKRVAEILKERTMTKSRLILCLVLSAAALFLAVRTATSLFPLRVHAQELSSEPIQILQGGENLARRAALAYPRRALERHVEGDVALQVSVNEQGQVSDARVLSGPEDLRSACLRSVLEWRFRAPAPGDVQVVVHFQLPEEGSSSEIVLPAVPEEHGSKTYFFDDRSNASAESRIKELKAQLENPETSAEDRAKDEIVIAKLKAGMAQSPDKVAGGSFSPDLGMVVEDSPELARATAELKSKIADPATPPEDRAKLKKQLAEQLAELAQSRDEGTLTAVVRDDEPVNGRLTAVRTERVPQTTLDSLSPRLGVQVGDMINEKTAQEVRETVRRELGEQFRTVFHSTDDGGIEMVIVGP